MSIRFKNAKSWRRISSPKTETRHDHVEEGEVQEEFDANFRLLYALSRAYHLFLLSKAKQIQFSNVSFPI